jgi:hypothetical protein
MKLFDKNAAKKALKNSLGLPKFIIVVMLTIIAGMAISIPLAILEAYLLSLIGASHEFIFVCSTIVGVILAITISNFFFEYFGDMGWF